MKVPRICLNMIVKNESKIIHRLLTSVLPMIDCYCICDTGSTDDTMKIIESFSREHNIPGKIVREPFRDFGYNRTFALRECDKMENIDYIMLMDADMVLQNPLIEKRLMDSEVTLTIIENRELWSSTVKQKLWDHAAHHVFQGSDKFYYKNVRFVKHRSGMSYWGVTHEYVKVPEGTTYGHFERDDLFIVDVGDGGSKGDKFERDVKLLTNALKKEPNNDRYTFYLANSLRDGGRTQEAIELYKKRIKIGGWIEEIWHSWYSMGDCYKNIGNPDMAIHAWLEAYQVFPDRVENLFKITQLYREQGKNQLAYQFFRMADTIRQRIPPKDFLFMERDVYDFKLDYEMTVIGYYCNLDRYDLPKLCVQVMCHPGLDEWLARNILSNYKFYASKLLDIGGKELPDVLDDAIDMSLDSTFNSSTPSMVLHKGAPIVNVRHVNYYIDDAGGYVQRDKVETINIIRTEREPGVTETYRFQHNTVFDDMYVGLEDVRLFSYQDKVLYTANRGLGYSTFVVEFGELNVSDEDPGSTVSSVLLNRPNQQAIEKNWVLFAGDQHHLQCVYKWHPLTIGDIDPITGAFTDTHTIPTPPCFQFFRGSTHGINIGDEIWFICHLVSYEDRRYYYHVVVALDARTYQLRRFSRFFTFEGEKVEYTLGFIYMKEQELFRIGYSTMDRTTKFMEITKSDLENLFLQKTDVPVIPHKIEFK